MAFAQGDVEQDGVVGGHGEPGVLRQLLFELAGRPARTADGEDGFFHGVVLRQPLDDVARGGEGGVAADGEAALPCAARSVDDEASVNLHGAAHQDGLVLEAVGHVFFGGGEHGFHGDGRSFVDDDAHCAVVVVAADVNHAAGKKRVFQRGSGDEEMVGEFVHNRKRFAVLRGHIGLRRENCKRAAGGLPHGCGVFQTASYVRIAPLFFSQPQAASVWRPSENIYKDTDMAGHSKWANIQHKKARADAQRGKIFTRLIKEITVAARLGGGDPNSNPRLRLAMDKAWDANMPKDNVQRAIDKGTGNVEGAEYIELRYEGYGIGGAALMVDCMTDNKTRTVADVRHAFSKNGGNLGTDGCVAFNFVHQGYLVFTDADEDALMEAALEAGAEDVLSDEEGIIEVITAPADWAGVKAKLEAAGFKSQDGDVTMRAQNETVLTGEDAAKMQKLIDALENLDDVQNVYTSAVLQLD